MDFFIIHDGIVRSYRTYIESFILNSQVSGRIKLYTIKSKTLTLGDRRRASRATQRTRRVSRNGKSPDLKL